MSSYLTIKWTDAKPGDLAKPPPTATPAARIQMAVDGFACVKEASARKMPSVLFVFSEEKAKRDLGVRAVFNPDKAKAGEAELTEAAKRSLAVYERVFDNVQDVPLRILLRFFQCTRLDVTKVPGGAHPDLAEPQAPLVLIVDAQGKVVQMLSQTRIDSRSLGVSLVDVLKKGGLRDVETLCASTAKLMGEMENALITKGKIEIKMTELKTALADCEAKDRRRPNKTGQPLEPSASTVRARRAVEELQPALDAAEALYVRLKEKDAAMLRQAGVDITAWQKTVMPVARSTAAATGTGPSPGAAAAPSPLYASTPAAASSSPMRTWTSVSGKTLMGRFAELQQETVVLARPDGTTVQIPISKLSSTDQLIVRQLASATPR